ncbi:hypothetical protein D3C81_1695420 [compost metagenome]
MHVAAKLRRADVVVPLSGADQIGELHHPPRRGQDQRETGIGGGFGHRIGGIGQTDAAVAQIAQGVVVEASRHAGNHLERRRVVEQLSIQR